MEARLSVARQSEDVERFALLALARDWTQRSMLSTGEAALPLLGEALELLGPQPSALRVAVASAYCAESVTPGSNAGSTTEINKLLTRCSSRPRRWVTMRRCEPRTTPGTCLRVPPSGGSACAHATAAFSGPACSAPALWGAEALLAALFDSASAVT